MHAECNSVCMWACMNNSNDACMLFIIVTVLQCLSFNFPQQLQAINMHTFAGYIKYNLFKHVNPIRRPSNYTNVMSCANDIATIGTDTNISYCVQL